jgi:hypothetical protein
MIWRSRRLSPEAFGTIFLSSLVVPTAQESAQFLALLFI